MKSDNKDVVNFRIKDFRRDVTKKRSAIAAVALLFIPIFILTVSVTSCYSMDQKKSELSNMTSEVITDYEKDLLWMDYSKRGVNATGFSALPGGVLTPGGSFMGKGKYADFWSSTEVDSKKAWNRSLTWFPFHPGRAKIYRGHSGKSWGFSVRCLKDQ